MNRKTIAMAVLAAAPALPAQAAEPLSNSFLEAAYLNSAYEATVGSATTDDDIEGFRSQLSIGLAPYLNFIGDYDQRRYQDSRDSFGSAGLAFHTLDPNWQVFGAVTWEYAAYDDNQGSAEDFDEQGYGVAAGARAVMENVEFHAAYKYIDLGELVPEVQLTGSRYGAGVVIDLGHWWSLTGDYTVRLHETDSDPAFEEEWQEWSVGFRRYFVTQTDRRARAGGLISALFGGEEEESAEAAAP